MNTPTISKSEVVEISRDLAKMVATVRTTPDLGSDLFENWERVCSGIERQIDEDVIRVAVIGAIKSGKSTFVNSLLGDDHLKRGAGVVTSIVTRVRRGPNLKATLLFKTWDEVNEEMAQALVLFPNASWRSEDTHFDIRRQQEREDLRSALDALQADLLITRDTRNLNSVLLSSYLDGYERVKDIVSPEPAEIDFSEERFGDHRAFVGDDSLAVYVRDVLIRVDSERLIDGIEIADCQGSDSPNPIHLAMIQEYLLLTHLIVYVISSRTGLRQADIRFLSMIRKMGIMENILFVINPDFNEHESYDDYQDLRQRAEAEISIIKPSPELYSISALYHLFETLHAGLPERDRFRLEQWRMDKEMTALSTRDFSRFGEAFQQKITGGRASLLVANHLERLAIVSSGLHHWAEVNMDLISSDAEGIGRIMNRIEAHLKKVQQVRTMVKTTLDGVIPMVKKELRNETDRFFDLRYGKTVEKILGYVRNYTVAYDDYQKSFETTGFTSTLFLVFQDFRQQIDTTMTEEINPDIIRFIRNLENTIVEQLVSAVQPFDSLIRETIDEYNRETGSDEPSAADHSAAAEQQRIDLDAIKQSLGLKMPQASASIRYSAKVKTTATARLGFYTIAKAFKKLFKKPLENEKEEQVLALRHGVIRIKKETEQAIVASFKDYRENIKFQYLFKLLDGATTRLKQEIEDRFQSYGDDLTRITELTQDRKLDRDEAHAMLSRIAADSSAVDDRIRKIKGLAQKEGE